MPLDPRRSNMMCRVIICHSIVRLCSNSSPHVTVGTKSFLLRLWCVFTVRLVKQLNDHVATVMSFSWSWKACSAFPCGAHELAVLTRKHECAWCNETGCLQCMTKGPALIGCKILAALPLHFRQLQPSVVICLIQPTLYSCVWTLLSLSQHSDCSTTAEYLQEHG